MSNLNQMPGLRLKGNIWHIEKRCKYAEGGWIRKCTGKTSRIEAEEYLIQLLATLQQETMRREEAVYIFKEAAFRYLEDVAHKPWAGTIALYIDQLSPFIGHLALEMIHDGTLKPFVDHEQGRGQAPASINLVLGVVSAVLNRAARVWRHENGSPWLRQAPPLISRLSTKGKQKKAYPLSWEEQDRLFKLFPRHLADASLYAVNTGCREQEICQLRWQWEVKVLELGRSVFVLPESLTKTSTERVVVLNRIAQSVIDSRRGIHPEFVFTFREKPVQKLRASAWRRGWVKAGLPTGKNVLKGIHNLRHTFGRRLRAAGVPLETRKALLGHANGDITTHYSAAELHELVVAVEKISCRDIAQMPVLSLVANGTKIGGVGKVSEKSKRVSSC
ncbi:tyrosine-type recombinase/integrase [Porticoccus sp. W117]|uniref:tyrosine-type recombinase/integrase n=1 Tax=Porticoccus sp. W117 TaxID=3054777 RepID=UPI0025965F7B|nr:tyrosine-type recombinase/integrase [Porticoccus sp. W117]MDM3872359.1 tyrosine-type recombinase/integrase [Porticoccus sp. W117]